MSTITWSLISHTNVGKTTLARTLLRREIGEVTDQAHVTDQNHSYPLLDADPHRLVLWDTPGFGDSARLLKRLRAEGSPLAWLQSQVWDRLADRPLYCSQQAIHNVREEADLILYLVSAAELPEEAGYVPLEMELLSWTDRPVVILLNQVGESDAAALAETARAWEEASADWPAVRAVLPLDAHRRSWVEEGVLLEESAAWIGEDRKAALEAITVAWRERGARWIDASVTALAEGLATLIHHREPLEGSSFSAGAKRAARERIIGRVGEEAKTLFERWIEIHELTGTIAEEVASDWGELVDSGAAWIDGKKLGVGGALGGAATGAVIDAKALGLTLGAGTVIGGILGGIAGWGLGGWIAEKTSKGRHLRIGGEALDCLVARLLLGLLVVTHHGRGRGELRGEEGAAHFTARVDAALSAERRTLTGLWERGKTKEGDRAETVAALRAPLDRIVRQLLAAGGERIAATVSRIPPSPADRL